MSLILAVDDDRNMLKLLDKQIESMNLKMISAPNGSEGIDLAKTGHPDLILLDIMMPNMDGFDVIKALKKDENTKSIPIIMITSHSNKENVVKAMKAGVLDYIVKPYNFFSLSKKILIALRYSKAVKTKEAVSRTEKIQIHREKGITAIGFLTVLSDVDLQKEAQSVINSAFLNMTKKDEIVFDLRSLPEFTEQDIKPLENLISLIGADKVHIVAGKHYGELVALIDIEEKVNLFITMGDFEVFIEQK